MMGEGQGQQTEGCAPGEAAFAAAVKRLGPGRHCDGNGLYLEVDPSGARRWFLRVVTQGKRRDVGLGSIQLYGLAEAREKAVVLRRAAREGRDPVAERDKDRRTSMTFEQAARGCTPRTWCRT